MMRALLPVMILLSQILAPLAFEGDIVDTVCALFKSANTKEIGKNLSSSVEMTVNGEEDVYSKAQAEQILREFFTKNTPLNSSIVHRIDTNPRYRFGVLALGTKTGKYRVAVTLKKTANVFLITELRIEPDK